LAKALNGFIPIATRVFDGNLRGPASHALGADPSEPVIDIHQHTNYLARSDDDLVTHQRKMGVTKTILLPAGTP
jgi:hypothetical protein